MKITSRLLQAFLVSLMAAGVVILLELLLLIAVSALFNVRLIPRGLGWVVMPIAAGVYGWIAGWNLDLAQVRRRAAKSLEGASSYTRLWIVGSILWLCATLAFFLVFDPFERYRWRADEWIKFITTLLAPIVLGYLAVRLIPWAIRDERRKREEVE